MEKSSYNLSLSEFMKKLDMFGAPTPQLNFKGRTKLNTTFGACLTIGLVGTIALYSLMKLQFMLTRTRPEII